MDWSDPETDGPVTEWCREDGAATVRVRELPDDRYAVRFDRLEAAPEGGAYRRREREDRAAAEALAAEWRAEEIEAE